MGAEVIVQRQKSQFTRARLKLTKVIKKQLKLTKAAHPDVKINLEAVTGNDFGASLKAKMQSDPPTIFSVGGFQDLKDYGDILEDVSDLELLNHALEGTTDMFTKDGRFLRCRCIWKAMNCCKSSNI